MSSLLMMSIYVAISWSYRRILWRAVDNLVSLEEQPLASRGILLGGVEKAPRAGLGDNPNRPALCRSREADSRVGWSRNAPARKGAFRVECGVLRLGESGGIA